MAAVCAEAGGPEKDARAGEEAPDDDEGELMADGASRVKKGGESGREAAGSSEEEEKDEEGEDEGEGEGEEEVKKKGGDPEVEPAALLLSSCSRSSNSLSRSNASSTSTSSSWLVFPRRGQLLARGE